MIEALLTKTVGRVFNRKKTNNLAQDDSIQSIREGLEYVSQEEELKRLQREYNKSKIIAQTYQNAEEFYNEFKRPTILNKIELIFRQNKKAEEHITAKQRTLELIKERYNYLAEHDAKKILCPNKITYLTEKEYVEAVIKQKYNKARKIAQMSFEEYCSKR